MIVKLALVAGHSKRKGRTAANIAMRVNMLTEQTTPVRTARQASGCLVLRIQKKLDPLLSHLPVIIAQMAGLLKVRSKPTVTHVHRARFRGGVVGVGTVVNALMVRCLNKSTQDPANIAHQDMQVHMMQTIQIGISARLVMLENTPIITMLVYASRVMLENTCQEMNRRKQAAKLVGTINGKRKRERTFATAAPVGM